MSKTVRVSAEKLAQVLRAMDATLEEIMNTEGFDPDVEEQLREAGTTVEDLLVPGIHKQTHPMHEMTNDDMLEELGL